LAPEYQGRPSTSPYLPRLNSQLWQLGSKALLKFRGGNAPVSLGSRAGRGQLTGHFQPKTVHRELLTGKTQSF